MAKDIDSEEILSEFDRNVVDQFCELITELAKRSDTRGVSIAQVIEELRTEQPQRLSLPTPRLH